MFNLTISFHLTSNTFGYNSSSRYQAYFYSETVVFIVNVVWSCFVLEAPVWGLAFSLPNSHFEVTCLSCQVYGVCPWKASDVEGTESVMTVVTEIGKPLDVIKILQIPWDQRLRVITITSCLDVHLLISFYCPTF